MTQHMPSGRKKGGGRAPAEAADTLRSTQIAEIVMLIAEGEAQGLVNGLKSVYLDGVAVENADGSRNFENVEFAYTVGTQGQAAAPGMADVQAEVAVGVQIDKASPVTRTITDPAADQVRVTIGVPQLTEQSATGDLTGSKFEYAIELQANGGGFVEKHRATVDGKTTSRYNRAVVLPLTGGAPYDIRVRRITDDPGTVTVVNRFWWDSFTSIQTVKLRYPNSAIARLRVNAQNFGRIPVVAFDWLGQRVKVPVNYDPITRIYSGAWDGTFKLAWTSNPAWVFYDIVTHDRYGLGRFVPAALSNKWALYQIGQYCDAAVPDGRGGTEPRFTCNVNLETRAEAYNVLHDLAAVFRGMVFWAAGAVDFAQDAPAEAELLYTPANVVDGDFAYADTSHRQQHSVFMAQWNDHGQFGKQATEVYVDADLVARYGVNELHLQPLGCTSRGQAARVARWAAYSEQYEGEVVSFAVGADGVAARPGRIFKIADPNEAGERLGGRIQSATAALVTLDAPVALAAGESYSLSVMQPDAADSTRLVAEKRTVTTGAGTVSALAVSPAFNAAPAPETVWLLESNAVQATWWRCLSVEEVAGKHEWRITGVAHDPGKYDLIELGLKLDQRPISRLTLAPPKPASVAVTETPYLAGSITRSRVTVSWPEPLRGLTYLMSWRLANGPWTDLPATSANSVEVDGLARGVFEVSVRSLNALGNGSMPRTASVVLLGKTARPAGVAGFGLTLVQGAVLASWAPEAAADYLTSEIREGVSWESGSVLFEAAASKFTWAWPPLGTHTLWIKHFDTSLGESLTAASATVTVTSALYVQWGDVTGTGKPASNATSDLVLIGRGVDVTGNSAVKPGTAGWNADCYSRDSYTGGAYASAVAVATDRRLMFGLNSDPTFDQGYASLDYAWYLYHDGNLYIYESGSQVGPLAAFAVGDVLAVVYDGSAVRYLKNGAVLRTVPVAIGAPLYFDSAFEMTGARLDNIRFGPMSSNAWASVGGPGKPASYATVGKSLGLPFDSWALKGHAIVVLADGEVGSAALRLAGLAAAYPNQGNCTPIDASKKYRARFWARPMATTAGLLYFSLRQFLDAGITPGPLNGGRSPYKPAGQSRAAHNSQFGGTDQWGEYSFTWDATDWQAGVQFVQPEFLDNYSGAAGHWDVQDFTFEEVTEVVAAQSAADAAAGAATAAQGTANAASANAGAALAQLGDIASDAKLTPGEKQHVKREWDVIAAEKAGIDSQADNYGISVEKTAYGDAYAALSGYVTPLLADLGTTSDIVGATFRANFSALYTTRQALLNKIAEVAGTRATWASVSGTGRPADNATVGAAWGVNVTGSAAVDANITAAATTATWAGVSGVNVTTAQVAASAATEVVEFFDAAGVSHSNMG